MHRHTDIIRAAGIAALIVFGASCGRFGFDEEPRAADASLEPPIDASPGIDAEPAPLPIVGCAEPPDPDTLALYDFEIANSSGFLDTTGSHAGETVGALAFGQGAFDECGQALEFDGDLANYAQVPDDPSFVIPEGSVDLWFRVDRVVDQFAGLISRDSQGTAGKGHFTVLVTTDERVIARVQQEGGPIDNGLICTSPGVIKFGQWHHVGVNFGENTPAELWVDGVRYDEPGLLGEGPCQSAEATAIDNPNPWGLGLVAFQSDDGSVLPAVEPLEGALDHVRISRVQRDFSKVVLRPPDAP